MLKKFIAAAMTATICLTGVAAATAGNTTSTVSPITASAAESHQAFIESIGNAAVSYYSQYKILPSLTIAQAILESGWGTSNLAKYHNYFGMKARPGYTGPKIPITSQEYINGKWVTTTEYFMTFSSRSAGIKGYYDFINISRYDNLKGETNYKTACQKIRQDGWATAPDYSTRLIQIIEQNNLTRFDAKVIGGGNGGTLVTLPVGTPIYPTPSSSTPSSYITVGTVYTIVQEQTYNGVKYGKLKSGAGWVKLGGTPVYTTEPVDVTPYTKSFPAGTKLYKTPGTGTVAMTLSATGTYTIVLTLSGDSGTITLE